MFWSFFGGVVRAFLGPTVFSLLALLVPKKVYPNAATWSSSTWQIGAVLGPALAGFAINLIGVNWSMLVIVGWASLAFVCLFRIPKKPIMNPNIGEPVLKSLTEGIRFVFKTKAILGALTLDMVAVLFGGAVALLPVFAQDILKVGTSRVWDIKSCPCGRSIHNYVYYGLFSD